MWVELLRKLEGAVMVVALVLGAALLDDATATGCLRWLSTSADTAGLLSAACLAVTFFIVVRRMVAGERPERAFAVLLILGTVVAMTGLRMARSRRPSGGREVGTVLAELRIRLEEHRALHGTYAESGHLVEGGEGSLPPRPLGPLPAHAWAEDVLDRAATRLGKGRLRCRYTLAVAGPVDLDRPWDDLPAFPRGAEIFEPSPYSPAEPWFYALATCETAGRRQVFAIRHDQANILEVGEVP